MNGAECCLLPLVSAPSVKDKAEAGFLGLITLSDPSKNGNALNVALLQGLIQQLHQWQAQNVRAVILRSSSVIAFSVGMDFELFQSRSSTGKEAASLYRCCLDCVYRFPAPVFCILEKPARAGGVGLVMAADLVIAKAEASLTLGEALFGLIPANVMPYLRKRLSERKANQLVLLAEDICGDTLLEWGLVDFVTDEVEKTLRKLLRSILRCSPVALALQKTFSRDMSYKSFNEQQNMAEETLAAFLKDSGVSMAISAFLEGNLGPWNAKLPKGLL